MGSADRTMTEVSPPPTHSRPQTRENSPCPTAGSSNSARTPPPPKRWKRSFDMSGAEENGNGSASASASASTGGSDDALDYGRCYSNGQSKASPQADVS